MAFFLCPRVEEDRWHFWHSTFGVFFCKSMMCSGPGNHGGRETRASFSKVVPSGNLAKAGSATHSRMFGCVSVRHRQSGVYLLNAIPRLRKNVLELKRGYQFLTSMPS